MRELTSLEIDELDFSGRIPDLNVPSYQLIGLVAETPSNRKPSRKGLPSAKQATQKRPVQSRLARRA